MGDGILSPDEIDSLLMGGGDSFGIPGSDTGGASGGGGDIISPLQNVLSEASDNMGGALTALLGQTITIGKPEISLVTIAEVKDAVSDEMVSVAMDFESGVTGSHTYFLDANTSKSVAGLMLGQEEETVGEVTLGGVSEAMNIICGNETNNIGSKIKKDLRVGAPTTTAVSKNDISFKSENIYMATYSFTIEGKEPVKLIELFEESTVKNIAEKIAAATAPPPAKQASGSKSGGSRGGSSNMGGGKTMQQTPVQNAQFGNINDIVPDGQPSNINLLMDVNMELTVELGRTKKAIKEILSMGEGTVIELDKLAGEPVDILVNGKLIARGEVVVIDENFGVRVTEIVDAAERIRDFS